MAAFARYPLYDSITDDTFGGLIQLGLTMIGQQVCPHGPEAVDHREVKSCSQCATTHDQFAFLTRALSRVC